MHKVQRNLDFQLKLKNGIISFFPLSLWLYEILTVNTSYVSFVFVWVNCLF